MKRAFAILLLAAGTAFGQIDNPPSSVNIVDATATGRAVLTATNAAAAANAIGLGTTNNVTYNTVTLLGNGDEVQLTGSHIDSLGYGTLLSFEERRFAQSGTNIFDWGGTSNSLTVTPPATFSTNVTVNGALTVKSLTTTDPVGWALDAVQTAAATNGVLTLPDAANVLRITNANAISAVTNGRLGAFYYLINQTTNALTISNAGGITVQGGTPLTLGANQAATLVATGPTNASVAARGNLTDVTLGGTANTAPNQTASSGASIMTRDLSDARYSEWVSQTELGQLFFSPTNTISTTSGGSYLAGNTNNLWNGSMRIFGFTNANDYNVINVSSASIPFANSATIPFMGDGIGLYVRGLFYTGGTNRVARIIYGGVSSNQVAGIVGTNGIDRRGFALEIAETAGSVSNSLRLVAQDGTNGTIATGWTNVALSTVESSYFITHNNGTTRVYYGRDFNRPSKTPVLSLNHVLVGGSSPAQPTGILFAIVNTGNETGAGFFRVRGAWQMINANLLDY